MLTPLPGFLICKEYPTKYQTKAGLYLPISRDKNVTSEGVATVVSFAEDKSNPRNISTEDIIVYRGFLRFVGQLGDVYGAERSCDVFILHQDDVLGVITGPCVVGKVGEYVVEMSDAKNRKNSSQNQ